MVILDVVDNAIKSKISAQRSYIYISTYFFRIIEIMLLLVMLHVQALYIPWVLRTLYMKLKHCHMGTTRNVQQKKNVPW